MKTALYSKVDYKFYTTFCVIVINLQSISYCCCLRYKTDINLLQILQTVHPSCRGDFL